MRRKTTLTTPRFSLISSALSQSRTTPSASYVELVWNCRAEPQRVSHHGFRISPTSARKKRHWSPALMGTARADGGRNCNVRISTGSRQILSARGNIVDHIQPRDQVEKTAQNLFAWFTRHERCIQRSTLWFHACNG